MNSLDNYESAIKKNKTFLNEAQLTKSSAHILQRYDRDNKIPQNLVQSIKKVIECLYSFVKFLEACKVSEKLNLIYEPLENIEDCELLTINLDEKIDLKIIKVSLLSVLLRTKRNKFKVISSTSNQEEDEIVMQFTVI